MRSVEDMVLYLSNIASQSVQEKNLIGYYLALQLSKREDGLTMWDAFRRGEKCDPSDYLTPEAARTVADQILHSGEASPLTAENTKIVSEERLREFKGALQEASPLTILSSSGFTCGSMDERKYGPLPSCSST